MNGHFTSLDEACVPLLDWGFNKSDAVYDGIPFADGLIFRLGDHLKRFSTSMRKWRLQEPLSRSAIADICHDLTARSGLREGILYVCTTRGVPPSAEIRDPTMFRSRFYGWSQELPRLGTPEQLERGLSLIVSKVPRIPASSVDSTAKNFHWGDLIQARIEAADRGAQNALLLTHDGYIAEGVGFNVFIVIGSSIYTPARDCLQGMTRRTVLEIAETMGIDTSIGDIPPQQITDCSEIFMTSSAGGIFAVTTLDGRRVGNGKMGSMTRKIRREYWHRRVSPQWTEKVDYDRFRCTG